MAVRMVSAAPAESDATPCTGPLFEAFEWVDVPPGSTVPAEGAGDFAGKVRDVAHGIRSVLQILERDDLDEGCMDEQGATIRPILDIQQASNLHRLSITSLQMLAHEAERHSEWLEMHAKRSK